MLQNQTSPDRLTSDAHEAFTAYAQSDEYQRIRRGTLRKHLPNPEDQNDCGQEIDTKVFCKLFLEPDLMPPHAFDAVGGPAAPYVQRLATNTCIDYLRFGQRRPLILGYEASFEAIDTDPSSDPAVAGDVDRAISELAGNNETIESDLRLIQLHEDGYQYRDMAKMLYADDLDSIPLERLAERVRRQVRIARARLGETLLALSTK